MRGFHSVLRYTRPRTRLHCIPVTVMQVRESKTWPHGIPFPMERSTVKTTSKHRPTNSAATRTRKVIMVAIVSNLLIGGAKFIAAGFTRSSVMFSEGIHSLVDAVNDALVMFGLERSQRPADDSHPFGHGKELYFWSLVVAMSIFLGGALVTIYQGILPVHHPQPLENEAWSYVVLGF